ncbi:hypothetical protein EH203_14960 [Pectobacterium carotovorum subsp. carotovorum]|uniref:hypothetical protein n=1 Tax=Pectobacterium carotovorum TaxID=554 RepID=UPI00137440D1|nr:hypothetical protein [Pectobacterium carotovorum]QHP55025.1 hypothetical protein EH203_14960 [Pectobacterium carotovorum subsp. carotovorum]
MGIFKGVVWPCITIIAICITWALVNGDKAVDNINNFKKWYGSSVTLTGTWNNSTEYDMDPPEWLESQSEFVEVKITISDSVVDGTITTTKLAKILPFDFVLLTGKKKPFRNVIDAEAFDYIGGKRVSFGKFMISDDDGRLLLETKSSPGNLFPVRALLQKKDSDPFPEQNNKSVKEKTSN